MFNVMLQILHIFIAFLLDGNRSKLLEKVLFQGMISVHISISQSTKCSESRIVGGAECSIESTPFIVSIRSTNRLKHYCGGSLVSPQWVLSAAHCFDRPLNPWDVTVVAGLSKSQRHKTQAVQAERIFNHEEYDNIRIINDISLILLERRIIMFIKVIALINLPSRGLEADLSKYCNRKFIVAGWGSTEAWINNPPKYSPSGHLRCVDIPYMTNTECAQYSYAAHNPNVICTLEPGGGKDACQGDSGGPLFCDWIQYGIVSYGSGCAAPNRPGFYTRVDKYLDFIETTIETHKSCCHRLCIQCSFYFLSHVFVKMYKSLVIGID
ncbi:trypsin-like [Harmonia axyridis]|uniref:trypsin-like n=1 Tax=Harmonia axyridis TaxID=115357 RepID=UPI001E276242|nr:trypsin-like [Harmonia axyridis]